MNEVKVEEKINTTVTVNGRSSKVITLIFKHEYKNTPTMDIRARSRKFGSKNYNACCRPIDAGLDYVTLCMTNYDDYSAEYEIDITAYGEVDTIAADWASYLSGVCHDDCVTGYDLDSDEDISLYMGCYYDVDDDNNDDDDGDIEIRQYIPDDDDNDDDDDEEDIPIDHERINDELGIMLGALYDYD